MKNQQKPLLSRGALGSIFAIVALVTLSGYDIVPTASRAQGVSIPEKVSIKPSMVLAWSMPSFKLPTFTKSDTQIQKATPDTTSKSTSSGTVKKSTTSPLTLASAATIPLQSVGGNNITGPVIPELTDVEKSAKIRAYMTKYNMPLADYAAQFVEASQQCEDLDWRLLPAISVQESTGGKFMRLNNPFGWASARVGFTDLNDAIYTVSGHLCGLYDSTDQYYKGKTTAKRLWYYNGSVNPSYTGEVIAIMNKISSMPID